MDRSVKPVPSTAYAAANQRCLLTSAALGPKFGPILSRRRQLQHHEELAGEVRASAPAADVSGGDVRGGFEPLGLKNCDEMSVGNCDLFIAVADNWV
jgi:hypothetical protein